MGGQYSIIEDDLSGAAITALLRFHLDEAHRLSPPGSVHALPIERLRRPDVSFFSAWDENSLAACGALKHIDEGRAELKAMRADPAYRGKGAGRAMLHHLLAVAKALGYARVSLETGRTEPFEPARRLYESHGFAECPPFGDYTEDPFSICMTRDL